MKKVKISFNAPVTLGIFLICFVVTIIGITTHGRSTQFLFMTYHSSLANPLTYLRFFTHIFGHDGINHFIGNATYLLLLGPLLEEKYGSMNLIKMVCVTAFITGIINYVVSPNTALCGASGIVFAFIVLSSFTGFKEGEIPLTFVLVVILFVGQQVYEGVAIRDNISQLTHVIGGAIGAFVGYRFNKRKL
ncbi:rhomboid family intramembrane serine protease [Dorea sp. YH-dor228]|uniref:rhomboid family intramembrane serine protease n=1 Tax=Dorea sp. YH-dor228 TaxID=3151120 RepID=UPI003242D4BA